MSHRLIQQIRNHSHKLVKLNYQYAGQMTKNDSVEVRCYSKLLGESK